MAGMEFEYDQEGSTFFYFLLSFWALVIIPATYYGWPRAESADEEERKKHECHCPQCESKKQRQQVKTSWVKTRRKAIQIALILGWVIFFALAYKVTTIKIEYSEYDPYTILQIDRDSTEKEIKKAYRKLSLVYHPDRETGDEKKFMAIAKAYAALTDEESRENWEQHGNPDGPVAPIFGIALPSWLVDDKNSMWVLLVYIVIFMVIMPAVVGMWWYRSIKFSKDQVLLDTTRLYLYFFSKNPQMILKKVIMVLGASFEFDKSHNSEIVERPSDNEEVPLLMKQLPNLDEKNKERPLCFLYSLKARALLHAHFARMELPPASLELDRRYVLQKCPALINEMINLLSQLVASAMARQRITEMPRLDTVENCMKVSQMVTQALESKASPLQQLPHIRPDMLRHFVTKRRNVQRIRDLVALEEEERRALLRSLSDEKYQDIMNVCATLPNVEMVIRSEVMDDEDNTITAGSIVTVTVSLKRKNMMTDFDITKLTGSEIKDEEEVIEEEKEVTEDGGKDGKVEDVGGAEGKHKAWQKPTKGKKKGGKAKKVKQAFNWKKQPGQTASAKGEEEGTAEGATGGDEWVDCSESDTEEAPAAAEGEEDEERESDVESEHDVESQDDDKPVPPKKKPAPKRKRRETENDEDDWDKYQEESKKENSLETKKKESHPVHCPYFPEEKQEGWWLYVADRKNHMLITAPVQILSLKKEEEMSLKFSAPPKIGVYTYSVVLRSDSYFDFDQSHNFKLDVKEAKVVQDHPQWDISDTEDEADNHQDNASNDSDYSTDDDEEYDD